jgi:hypothetical protein
MMALKAFLEGTTLIHEFKLLLINSTMLAEGLDNNTKLRMIGLLSGAEFQSLIEHYMGIGPASPPAKDKPAKPDMEQAVATRKAPAEPAVIEKPAKRPGCPGVQTRVAKALRELEGYIGAAQMAKQLGEDTLCVRQALYKLTHEGVARKSKYQGKHAVYSWAKQEDGSAPDVEQKSEPDAPIKAAPAEPSPTDISPEVERLCLSALGELRRCNERTVAVFLNNQGHGVSVADVLMALESLRQAGRVRKNAGQWEQL